MFDDEGNLFLHHQGRWEFDYIHYKHLRKIVPHVSILSLPTDQYKEEDIYHLDTPY